MQGPQDFNTLDKYPKYIIKETDPDSASNKISTRLDLLKVCAPVNFFAPSTEASAEGQRNPYTPSTKVCEKKSQHSQQTAFPVAPAGNQTSTTPSSEVPVVYSQKTSVPITATPTKVRSTSHVFSSKVSTKEVIYISPTAGQTDSKVRWFPLIRNASIELMQEDPASIPSNELIAALPPFWGPEVVNDYGVRIPRRIGPYFPTEKADNLTVRYDSPSNFPQRDVVVGFRTEW
ncbi:hypothetical protein P9112_009805 [Eukaryota sp. TZLM1-RC]